MKDTRKLSLIYFVISVVMLLLVCFGCESQYLEIDYIHSVNGYDVYYSHDIQTKDELENVANYLIEQGHNNFIVHSDFGFIEVENGSIVYITK